MKVFISTDMEGTAGVVDWEQCSGDSLAAQEGRRLLLGETNAAIGGALEGGADLVVVNDSHSTMRNLPPDALLGETSYISGQHKPMYMMQGLDHTFDAVLFISYHGSIGAPSGLSHTYNPNAVAEARLNGTVVGEAGINALVAAHYRVPVVTVSGDGCCCEETSAILPGIKTAVVKDSVSRMAAHSLHPLGACRLIREASRAGVMAADSIPVPDFGDNPLLELDVRTTDIAEAATWIRGVERSADRTLAITGPDTLAIFRSFASAILLTRKIAEFR